MNAPSHDEPTTPDWLSWARLIQAAAQTGLTYAESPYDRERYKKLDALAVEIFAAYTGETPATMKL